MIGPADGPQEAPEHGGEAVPGLLGTDVRNGRRGPQQKRELRGQLHQQLTQAADSLQDVRGESLALLRVAGLQLAAQVRQGLAECEIRDVLLVLVELALDEEAIPVPDRPGELMHEGRLPYPGVPRHQEDQAGAVAHTLEGLEERGDLPVATVQPVGDREQVHGGVPRGEVRIERSVVMRRIRPVCRSIIAAPVKATTPLPAGPRGHRGGPT